MSRFPNLRALGVSALLTGGLLCSSTIEAEEAKETEEANKIVVDVSKIQNDKGDIGCALYDQSKGFPTDSKKAKSLKNAKIKEGKAVCIFDGVKPGQYAISVMHDEDKNGELNTRVFGIPTEGWGVSNNVPARRMGPPKYEKAKFKFEGGEKRLSIRLNY